MEPKSEPKPVPKAKTADEGDVSSTPPPCRACPPHNAHVAHTCGKGRGFDSKSAAAVGIAVNHVRGASDAKRRKPDGESTEPTADDWDEILDA